MPPKKRNISPGADGTSRQLKKLTLVASPATPPPKRTLNTPPTQRLVIYVCGSGDFGELGLGASKVLAKRPVLNTLLDADDVGVVQIAVGGMHCVALTHDNQILTWGVNDNGALGRDTDIDVQMRDAEAESEASSDDEAPLNPRESTPAAVPPELFGDEVPRFAQVAATDSASFALTVDGLVYGWGTFMGDSGRMGFSEENARESEERRFQQRPGLIPRLKNIAQLAAGANHVLALDHSGNVFAWGCGQQRQLGRRILPRFESHSLTPEIVGLPKRKTKHISCGAYHSFAIDTDDELYSWGLNNFGQTGVPINNAEETSIVEKPTRVTMVECWSIKQISGGTHHTIACTQWEKILTWGRCDDCQLGRPLEYLVGKFILDSRKQPRILSSPYVLDFSASAVAAGADNSLSVSSAGGACAWGFSANYRTGLGTEKSVGWPMSLTGIRRPKWPSMMG